MQDAHPAVYSTKERPSPPTRSAPLAEQPTPAPQHASAPQPRRALKPPIYTFNPKEHQVEVADATTLLNQRGSGYTTYAVYDNGVRVGLVGSQASVRGHKGWAYQTDGDEMAGGKVYGIGSWVGLPGALASGRVHIVWSSLTYVYEMAGGKVYGSPSRPDAIQALLEAVARA